MRHWRKLHWVCFYILGIAGVAALLFWRHDATMCSIQETAQRTTKTCRPLEVTDPPVVLGGLLFVALLWPLVDLISVFGVEIRRRVDAVTSRAQATERTLDRVENQLQTLQSVVINHSNKQEIHVYTSPDARAAVEARERVEDVASELDLLPTSEEDQVGEPDRSTPSQGSSGEGTGDSEPTEGEDDFSHPRGPTSTGDVTPIDVRWSSEAANWIDVSSDEARDVARLLIAWRKIEELLETNPEAQAIALDLRAEIETVRTIRNSVAHARALPEGALSAAVDAAMHLAVLLSRPATSALSLAARYEHDVRAALAAELSLENVQVLGRHVGDSAADLFCRIDGHLIAVEVKLTLRVDRAESLIRQLRRLRKIGAAGLVVVTQSVRPDVTPDQREFPFRVVLWIPSEGSEVLAARVRAAVQGGPQEEGRPF